MRRCCRSRQLRQRAWDLWTPDSDRSVIRSGLYLDAARKMTVVSGAVSRWDDTDNKWAFTQSNASLRPQYSATGWNGSPALNVTSTSQLLVGTANFTPLINSSGFTVFASINHTATGWFFEHGNATPGARTGLAVISNQLYGVINGQVTIGNMSPSTNNIAVWRFDGSASTKSLLRLNGADLVSGGITATATTSNAGALNIGFGVDPNTFVGLMRDLIILPYAASDALIRKIEGFLYWKSGQLFRTPPARHPFKLRPPLVGD